MTAGSAPARFRYEDFEIAGDTLRCRYSLGELTFVETVAFSTAIDPADEAARAAARLVFLLAGISYYKTSAPEVVDLGRHAVTAAERHLLESFYRQGLGEFAYRNALELRIEISGAERPAAPVGYAPETGRPLVPFGGGIDSIVSVEHVRGRFPDAALFVASQGGRHFEAIEAPAALTGLAVERATRSLDAQVLRSRELGFRNGHVPVTGIISAIAVMAAVLARRDAVVMSNEHSASAPTLVVDGRGINHQYSKSWDFETAFRAVLAETFGEALQYFSLLRPYSELWVAHRFAQLTPYHQVFRSCNRAFHIDPAARLDHWCGHCDKCCFIDLVLAPFLAPAELAGIFAAPGQGISEPLRNPALADQFRALLNLLPDAKPFECVGDVDECRAAIALTARRPDRADDPLVQQLAVEAGVDLTQPAVTALSAALLSPLPPDAIPDAYSPEAVVV